MKTKFILGVFALASLGLAACSKDDVPDEVVTPNPDEEIQPELLIKRLGTFQFETYLGKTEGGFTESRTPGDVDDRYRPINKYPFNYVYMMSLVPESDVQKSDKGKAVKLNFKGGDNYKIQKHAFQSNGKYNLYYRVNISQDNSAKNASNSGTIEIAANSEMKNALKYELSIFDLNELHKKDDRIALNNFAFDHGITTKLRGSVLRYGSYDTKNDLKHDDTPHEGLKGWYAELPAIDEEKYQFMKGKDTSLETTQRLVSESKDSYFTGNEFFIAADNEKVYMLEVIPQETSSGGIFRRRTYPSSDNPGDASPDYLGLNRLTSIVNASFMIMDDSKGTSEYFIAGNEEATLANFKQKYGVDLANLECPYASIDGINARYYLGEIAKADKTVDKSRLVLWAKDYKAKDASGKTYEKFGERSMNVLYDHGNGVVARGYGILGNSYSVVFPGDVDDTKGQEINFWTTLEDGVKVKIMVNIHDQGINLAQNVAHHIIVFVPVEKFVDSVEAYRNNTKSRANGTDDFIELRLPSDCVKIQ